MFLSLSFRNFNYVLNISVLHTFIKFSLIGTFIVIALKSSIWRCSKRIFFYFLESIISGVWPREKVGSSRMRISWRIAIAISGRVDSARGILRTKWSRRDLHFSWLQLAERRLHQSTLNSNTLLKLKYFFFWDILQVWYISLKRQLMRVGE